MTVRNEVAVAPAAMKGPLQRLIKEPILWIMVGIFALLAVADPGQVGPSLVFMADSVALILPWVALAVLFAAYVQASEADQLIARAFSGRQGKTVVVAALIGALSPFCSCGVIPLIAALLAGGVPLAPVMAFWLASPIMDPEMFILTAAEIGIGFAVAKTAAAIGIGLLGGAAILAFDRAGILPAPLRAGAGNPGCGGAVKTELPIVWAVWRQPDRMAAFWPKMAKSGWFLGKWLTFAFLLESLMVTYVPAETIGGFFTGNDWLTIPLAALVGAPAYLNGYAAIPLIDGLIEIGVSAGVAMTFVTAGAVSSIPAAIAVFALVRWPVFVMYLGIGAVGSMLAGAAYQLSLGI